MIKRIGREILSLLPICALMLYNISVHPKVSTVVASIVGFTLGCVLIDIVKNIFLIWTQDPYEEVPAYRVLNTLVYIIPMLLVGLIMLYEKYTW